MTPEFGMAEHEWKPGEANDFVLMITQDRKKRVEVELRDLCAEDQKRFVVSKRKELSAWLSHKTAWKVSQGRIPEYAIMRCGWLIASLFQVGASLVTSDNCKSSHPITINLACNVGRLLIAT